MADYLKKELGVEVELVQGSGGVFEITANGQLIFSRKQTGRFPEEKEIKEKLEAMM